jgi:DNA modification methylase
MSDLGQRMVTADARDWLRGRERGEFDLIFSDPPYGIDHYKQGHKTDAGSEGLSEYDDSEGVSLDLFVDMVPQMIRTTKETGWVILFQAEANYEFLKHLFEDCCLEHFDYRCYRYSAETEKQEPQDFCLAHVGSDHPCRFGKVEEPRWIWYRPNSQNNPRNPEIHAKNLYEHLLVFNRGSGKLLRPCGNVLAYDAEYGSRIHAMQKPVELCVDIISRVTLGGERMADPFYGSGALLKAGARLARDIVGCEKNPALRAPAMGYVSEDYDGVAPHRSRDDNQPAEFLDTQLPEFADDDEMDELEV